MTEPTPPTSEIPPQPEWEILVERPTHGPANVDNLQLLMFYRYELLATHGGNVKISTDKAKTWQVMRPLSGYNGYFTENPAIPNPLNNEDIFTGSRPNLQQAVFDLLEHKGQQIRLRIDFAAPSQLAPQEFWSIQEAALTYSTLNTVDGGFNIPRSETNVGSPPMVSRMSPAARTCRPCRPVPGCVPIGRRRRGA
jgi:hypothetical protein